MSDQLEFGDDERSITLKRAWERALHILASKVNKVTFESYIRPIRPLSYDGLTVTLGVASPFAREWLKRYASLMENTLESCLGSAVDINFAIFTPEDRSLFGAPGEDPALAVVDDRPVAAAKAAKKLPPIEEIPSLPLNERFRFDNYVVGKSNRLAHAGAMAVADSPGGAYNPLFIYGGSGLGKTHLLHAIANAAKMINPTVRVALIDGENFTQHYVTALRERKTDDFRRLFRSIDIWLVDDVQFIAGREQTKEEFFHTFNALHQTGKQIVLSSDRSPRELRTMDERLRSRFECGLIADVNSPELETRVAILERRCEVEGWVVPSDVVYYIASAIQSNIRALEGALTKLVAYSSIMSLPYSIELAQSVLGEYFIERPAVAQPAKGVPVDTILRLVAEESNTTVDTLKGQLRSKNIAMARQIAMYLCRELTQTPLAQIGAAFGGRDHTTVQRAIGKIEGLIPYDPTLRQTVQSLRMKLER